MREFKLSEKGEIGNCICGDEYDENAKLYFKQEDVKEFIKLLKEKIDNIDIKTASMRNRLPILILEEVKEEIDKLAGEELK